MTDTDSELHRVLYDRRLTIVARLTRMYLAMDDAGRPDGDGPEPRSGLAKLASECGCDVTERAVSRALTLLEQTGWLRPGREPQPGDDPATGRYQLTTPD